MGLIDPGSLAETIDRIDEAFFYGRSPANAGLLEAARWVASTQG